MQKQQQYLFILAISLCSIALARGSPLSVFDDISDSGIALANASDESSSSKEQPLKRPTAADFDEEDENDDDYVYSNLFEGQGHDWDVLIFTQQWPVTTCYHWREQDPSHDCVLPQKKEFWTIHGIWPTKLEQIGPNFCNKSAEFNPDQLQAILDRLNTYWPDLEGNPNPNEDWLWKHEWLKHGTCAAVLDALDDEFKYFSQGLKWRENFIMSRILDAAGIHPDSNNTVIALNNAIVRGLGKNPSIHCLYDGKHGISYLSEIRICFNKSLELIDCDGVKHGDLVAINYPGGTVNTNCHIGNPVHYPSLVPPLQRKEEWKFPLVNFYKLLQFLMWFTL